MARVWRIPTVYVEKFDQAISDYTAGLAIKDDLLPLSSRQIAEAHYKLSIVLDLTSGSLAVSAQTWPDRDVVYGYARILMISEY